MDDKQFEELTNKLNLITKLLALNLVKDFKIQKDQIIMLSSFGFQPSEIAELLGTTANTVNVVLSRARKKERKHG
jgi:DNA-directed RNA polymerase specialized sigma24 family protein